jgi:alanine dehydrogenase
LTHALTNATLPYALEIANKGYKKVAHETPEIARVINMVKGELTYEGVAQSFNMRCTPLASLL